MVSWGETWKGKRQPKIVPVLDQVPCHEDTMSLTKHHIKKT